MRRRFLFCILLCTMLLLLSLSAFAMNDNTPAKLQETQIDISLEAESMFETKMYYPVVDTPQWKQMGRSERVAACQISDDELSQMSTEILLQYILEYPFMVDIGAYDDSSDGFLHVYSEFPALGELSLREDFPTVTIAFYKNLPTFSELNRTSDYKNTKKLSNLKTLLNQPQMVKNFKIDEITLLNKLAREEKGEACDIITNFKIETDANSITSISFSNSLSTSSTMSYVTTPNGSSVPVYNRSSDTDLTSTEKAVRAKKMAQAYPGAIKLCDATIKYNCHSYAWYSESPLNVFWMNDPTLYMTDGSYLSTTSIVNGVRAFWYNSSSSYPIEHSAIIAPYLGSNSGVGCNSKWGEYGVYNHLINDCPYYGAISYWKYNDTGLSPTSYGNGFIVQK